MAQHEPPEWADDPLSRFLKDSEYNARAIGANYQNVLKLLRKTYSAFESAENAVEMDSDHKKLIPRFLLTRTHSTVFAAIRLSMSGQIPESFVLLRAAIEQSWYALHMASEPESEKRTEIWFNRNESKQEKNACRSEFSVKKIRTTHESLDPATAAQFHKLYEALIDFGAHPNQMGMLTSVKRNVDAPKDITDYKIGILYIEEVTLMSALYHSVAVAVGALKIFQLLYKERFALVGLDIEINELVVALNTIFKDYAPSQEGEEGTQPN